MLADGQATAQSRGKLVRSRQLWAVCFMYVVTNFCWYSHVQPAGLADAYGLEQDRRRKTLLLLAGRALVGMAGCLLGGALARYIRRTGDRKWGRRLMGIGCAGAGVCHLVAAGVYRYWPNDLWPFAIMLMGFCNDLIMARVGDVSDIGRQYAATVSGR